jgi:hypothetical protein
MKDHEIIIKNYCGEETHRITIGILNDNTIGVISSSNLGYYHDDPENNKNTTVLIEV